MRAETRHQLKEDRFSKATIEAAEKTVNWSQEHQGKLIVAAIAIVVVAAIAFGGWYYVSAQDEKASFELAAAVRTLETPLRPAGTPEQPGFPSFESATARATEARKEFQAIADKYPQTHTGKMARYFVGLMAAQLGDNATAEHNLQEAAGSSDAGLASLAKFALASVYAGRRRRAGGRSLHAANRQANDTCRQSDGATRTRQLLRHPPEAGRGKKYLRADSEGKSVVRGRAAGAAAAGAAEVDSYFPAIRRRQAISRSQSSTVL